MGEDNRARRGRLSETIARTVQQEIASGKFGSGTTLPSERQLADRFGASRSSAREALRLLQAGGLITNRAKARAVVGAPDQQKFLEPLAGAAKTLLSKPGGVPDFQEARILFECGLARHAARHASDEEIAELRSIVEGNRLAIGDDQRFVDSDTEIHTFLAKLPGNPLFVELNAAVSDWLQNQRKVSVREKGADRLAYENHKAIFDAIEARDPEAADAAMAAHLSLGLRIIWRQLNAGRSRKK